MTTHHTDSNRQAVTFKGQNYSFDGSGDLASISEELLQQVADKFPHLSFEDREWLVDQIVDFADV